MESEVGVRGEDCAPQPCNPASCPFCQSLRLTPNPESTQIPLLIESQLGTAHARPFQGAYDVALGMCVAGSGGWAGYEDGDGEYMKTEAGTGA